MKSALALAAAACLTSSVVASDDGAAIPAGVQAPSTAGLNDASVHMSRGGRAVCVSGTIPVQASTTKNLKFNFQVPQNQTGLTQTFVSLLTPGTNFLQGIMGGMQTVSGTYQIGASLCAPKNSTPSELQFLTHGVGFDRYYWDFAPGYSYVDFAAENGYATFLYDRLGVGTSEKPDPLQVVQGPLEAAIATTLAQKLRQASIGGHHFSKIIGVGHSFGSLITQSITSQSPSTFDGAVLTGFSSNSSGLAAFTSGLNVAIASQDQPSRFSGLNPGYFVASTAISNQIAFFHFPGFDAAIANEANEQKGTATYGELFTQNVLPSPALTYTGPVTVVNGFEDLPFCYGNCTYPVDKGLAALATLYPLARNKTSYYGKNAGHGLNLHYSAVDAYAYIQNFLKSNGQ